MTHPNDERELIERAEEIERTARESQRLRAWFHDEMAPLVDAADLPVLRPVLVRPVKLSAPEFCCYACGEPIEGKGVGIPGRRYCDEVCRGEME